MNKNREFVASRCVLQKTLKRIPQAESKWFQTVIKVHTYTHKKTQQNPQTNKPKEHWWSNYAIIKDSVIAFFLLSSLNWFKNQLSKNNMHIIALVGPVTYGNVIYLAIKAQRQLWGQHWSKEIMPDGNKKETKRNKNDKQEGYKLYWSLLAPLLLVSLKYSRLYGIIVITIHCWVWSIQM